MFRYIKYIQRTTELEYKKGIDLKIFVDADYAGDQNARKSTSGFLMHLGDTPISWYSKRQHCVSTSNRGSRIL